MNRKLKSIFSEIGKVPASEILYSTHLIKDLGLDSLDIFLLALKQEDCFKIDVSDLDYPRLLTLKEIDQYISEKRMLDKPAPKIKH